GRGGSRRSSTSICLTCAIRRPRPSTSCGVRRQPRSRKRCRAPWASRRRAAAGAADVSAGANGITGANVMTRARQSIASASDTIYASAAEIAGAVRAKTVKAADVTEAHLARIAKVNPVVNGLIALDADGARAAARAIDKRIAAGE